MVFILDYIIGYWDLFILLEYLVITKHAHMMHLAVHKRMKLGKNEEVNAVLKCVEQTHERYKSNSSKNISPYFKQNHCNLHVKKSSEYQTSF